MKKKFALLFTIAFVFSCSLPNQESDQSSLNGSYAKLLTVGNYLYAINDSELATFDITDKENPIELNKQDVGFKIENIYHSNGVLFIGSESALHIFIIKENGVPERKSETSYFNSAGITSCDPVIVSGNYAFVTLSTITNPNSSCFRSIPVNELRIYDISDIENPVFVTSLNLDIPKGLAIDGQYLFVCLEKTGLVVLDISNIEKPEKVYQLEQFESYDVIAKDGLLMIVCPTEIREYDYSDIQNIKYLNSIDI